MPTTLEQALNVIEMLAAHIHTMVVMPANAVTLDAKRTTEALAASSVKFVRELRQQGRAADDELTVHDICRIFDVPRHRVFPQEPPNESA